MTIVSFQTAMNMAASTTDFGGVLDASPTLITLTNGSDFFHYIGQFTFIGSDVFGTLTNYRAYYNGFLAISASGMNVDAHTVQQYIQSNQLQPLLAYGLNGDDLIQGSTLTDRILGYSGNDRIVTNGGNDIVEGGSGIDTVVLNAPLAATTWQFSPNRSFIDVQTATNVTSLIGVERVQLQNAIIAFDQYGNAGDAYRIYQAAFDRTPDRPGLSYWVNQMDDGMPLSQVALNFILSPEFATTYGNINAMSNAQFVNVVYDNVLHRAPDTSGFNYWMNDLEHGYPRHFMLAAFSQSFENQSNVAAAIQNGILLDLGAFL